MFRHSFRILYILSVFQLLLPISTGQLTGNITSPGNQFIVICSIDNPTTSTISILAWNNIFDNATQLPISFAVIDDQGNTARFASTYAMRAGMTNDDFYDILPGQSFTRLFDMRQFLQTIPSGPSTTQAKVIQVELPLVFKGIVHSGSYQIPAAAGADLTAQPPQLGDFSAAGLQDISLSSTPIKRALDFPIFGDLDPGYSSAPDGIHVQTDDCQAENFTDLSDTISDAGIYAKSVYLAAQNATSVFFGQFFNAGLEEGNVTNVASMVMNATNGVGPHVDVYCTDGLNLCGSDSNILGYSWTPSWLGDASITLCPSARNLGRAPAPCTTSSGAQLSTSASHVMFHLILTLNNVVGTLMDSSVYGSTACQRLRDSLVWNPTMNADSYVQLAIAQWAYGLGGSPYNGPPCYSANGGLPNTPKRIRNADAHPRGLTSASNLPSSRLERRLTLNDIAARATKCSATENQLLQYAVQNVNSLAAAARDDTHSVLWQQYFNGDAAVEASVNRVYDNIAKWNATGNNNGITIYCDPLRKTQPCYSNRIAKVDYNAANQAIIVLCPAFFYYPASIQCLNPATIIRGQGYDLDQAGTLLHEFSHVPWIGDNHVIGDGYNPNPNQPPGCYEYSCVVYNALHRNDPGFDSRNLPENVATNYEYYAYAARAYSVSCSWTNWAGSQYGLWGFGWG